MRSISPALAGKPLSSSTRACGRSLDWRSNEPKVRKAERPSLLMQRTQIKRPFAQQMVELIGIEPMT